MKKLGDIGGDHRDTNTHAYKQHIHYIHTLLHYHTMKPAKRFKTKHALDIRACVRNIIPRLAQRSLSTFDLHIEGTSRSLAARGYALLASTFTKRDSTQHSRGHTWGQLFATVHEVDTTPRALPGSKFHVFHTILSERHGMEYFIILSWMPRILAVGPGSKIVGTFFCLPCWEDVHWMPFKILRKTRVSILGPTMLVWLTSPASWKAWHMRNKKALKTCRCSSRT